MAIEEEDLKRDDGLVRKLRYGKDEVAVVDVSPDVLTVNWTTHQTAPEFVDFACHVPGYETADAVVCRADQDLYIDMEGLSRLAKDNAHSHTESWGIVRLDLSDTRSVAWERLPGGVIVVGFGDDINCMHGGLYSEAAEQLGFLLKMTGTSGVRFHEVVETAVKLSQLWGHPGERAAAAEPAEPQATDTEWHWHEGH